MATSRDKYNVKMLETLVYYNDRNNVPFSNEKLRQAIITVVVEMEENKRNIISDANNVTIDSLCQSPITTNTQGDNVNSILTSKRQKKLDVLTERLKVLTNDSTINDSAYYNSDKNDAESDPKSDPLVATHTSDRK